MSGWMDEWMSEECLCQGLPKTALVTADWHNSGGRCTISAHGLSRMHRELGGITIMPGAQAQPLGLPLTSAKLQCTELCASADFPLCRTLRRAFPFVTWSLLWCTGSWWACTGTASLHPSNCPWGQPPLKGVRSWWINNGSRPCPTGGPC